MARRPQRSSEEVERLLLEVARDLFGEKGYQATTTMEIGKRANVSERLIFSKFGTKAGLFSAAVIAPFAKVVDDYAEVWIDESRESSTDERVDNLLSRLYDLAREHRIALLTALAEDQGSLQIRRQLLDQLARSFQRISRIAAVDGFEEVDWPAAVGTVVGMVLGAALLDDLIYPADEPRPTRRRLLDEMRTTLLHGYASRLDI